jgi:hypothetical protein
MELAILPDDYKSLHAFFLLLFLLFSLFDAIVIIFILVLSRKYNHIKAKDPINFILIFITGTIHSWSHFLYNEPLYDSEGDVNACLFIGYVFQHLLGSTFWFYCIWFRLIKFGSIFDSLEVNEDDSRYRNVYDLEKRRCGFFLSFKRRYRFATIVAFTISTLPIIIFIIMTNIGQPSIYVDTELDLCFTVVIWKEIFVSLNVLYFIILAISLCFIPRRIHNKYFNEAKALRDIVFFSGVIFVIETWLSFRYQGTDYEWSDISDLLIFILHTFTIVRLIGYSIYKTFTKKAEYEEMFLSELTNPNLDTKLYIDMTTPKNTSIRASFFSFIEKNYPGASIDVRSTLSLDKTYPVLVSDISNFIQKTYCYIDEYSHTNLSPKNYTQLELIVKDYIVCGSDNNSKINKIGLDGAEQTTLSSSKPENIGMNSLCAICARYTELLCSVYSEEYISNSKEIMSFFQEERSRRKVIDRLAFVGLTRSDFQKKTDGDIMEDFQMTDIIIKDVKEEETFNYRGNIQFTIE